LETKEYSYTVLFEPAEEGGYVVRVPALPEIVTEGDTLEEARARAEDAIRLVLQDRLAEGASVPCDIEAEPIKEKVRVVVPAA
jgi:antitoxin HicB